MKNNFIVASINKSGQMFKQISIPAQIDNEGNEITAKSTKYEQLAIIPEHITRLAELSENCHFFIDSKAFKAMNEKSIPGRFTRIFVYDEKDFDREASTMYRMHQMSELDTIVTRLMYYQPDVHIFFIGFPEFLEKAEKYCSSVLLTVSKTNEVENSIDFPESLKKIFCKKISIKPEQLDIIRKFNQNNRKHNIQTITYAKNGAKIIKNEKIEMNGILANIPEYYFYQMNR